jgi:predicted DNA-binding transcriptional regulator AlpA
MEDFPARCAFTINEFCEAHRISRSKLYMLWREGTGPRTKSIGNKRIITAEAAAEWRTAGEATSEAA